MAKGIRMAPHVEIIAELGVNHNGDLELAREMLAAAAEAGADTIKLQTYKAEDVMTADTPLADYMINADDPEAPKTFLDLARRLELAREGLAVLQADAERLGVDLISSPFDVPSVYLLKDAGFKRLKLPSGELVNPYILEAAAATGLPLIVSTGMATLEEVKWAMAFLKERNSGPVTLLQCLTQYPAEHQYVNLRAMATLREMCRVPVGFSDHTPGIAASVAAVALGATVVEKHFTTSHDLPGPDQKASMTPEQFAELVKAIREVEAALGSPEKVPTPPELDLIPIVRKSLMLRQNQSAGTVITAEMLTSKRPGSGIPARERDHVIGRELGRDVQADALLNWDDFA